MKKGNLLSRWILISGIILSVIAILHNSFAPAMLKHMLNDEAVKDKANGFVYFFVVAGTAFLFAGFMMIYSSFGLKKFERWAYVIALSASIFAALGGVGALTYAGFVNPLIYTQTVCSFLNILILMFYFKKCMNQ